MDLAPSRQDLCLEQRSDSPGLDPTDQGPHGTVTAALSFAARLSLTAQGPGGFPSVQASTSFFVAFLQNIFGPCPNQAAEVSSRTGEARAAQANPTSTRNVAARMKTRTPQDADRA